MAAIKNKLRRAVIYTMIAANAGTASPAWMPRYERLGGIMAETTVKGVEKKDEDARLKKGAKMLYDTYKKLYPKVDEKQYYNYLRAFGKKLSIYNVEAFNASIGDVRNIGNGQMTLMAVKELERQRTEKTEAESTGKSFAAQKERAKAGASERAAERAEVSKEIANTGVFAAMKGEITPATKPARLTAPAIIAGSGIAEQTQSVFQTEQNVLRGSDGSALLDSRGATQYAYPSNMASLQSLGRIDYGALKDATGTDFIDQLRKSEAKGGTADERGARSFEITATMVGAIVLYNAFMDKAGAVKKNQLKDYCADDGYAENLGRVLSAKPLRNQTQFIGEVTSFIGAYIKNGKLTEINGEGKDEKGKSNIGMYVYSIAATGSAYSQRVIGETFESQMTYLQERKQAAEKQKAELQGQLKEEANVTAAAKRAKKMAGEDMESKLNRADAELQSVNDMIDGIGSYSWYYKKPMTVAELYKRHRDEDRKRLTSLVDYTGSLNIPQRLKRPFQDALEDEKTQMVMLQMAIEEANPEGRMTLSELKEKGNVWRNYKTLVTHKLKEIATYKLNKSQRLAYVMLNNRYADVIDNIEAKLGPEETARFVVDLADPSQAKKQNMSYDEYIRFTLREAWINGGVSPAKDAKGNVMKDPKGNVIRAGRSCLDDYRREFNNGYGQKYGLSLDSQRFPDRLVASLVIDHRISPAELDFLVANRGDMKPEEALNAFNAKLNDAKKNFNVKEYSTIKRAVDEAKGLIGFDDAYYEEFRDIVLVRLALIDMTNPATQRTSSLTLNGIVEGNLSGVRAFGAKIAALVAKVDEVAPLEKMPDNVTGDAKGMLLQRARTQRVNAYIELFNNEFFTLNDERYTKITVQRLNDFKLRLDTWEEILKTMKEDDPYHVAKDAVLKAGCIRTLESMKKRLDVIMKEVGDKGMDLSGIKDPGDRFLLDLVINGRVIIAGLNGFRYYDNVATVDKQGFIPVIFYFLNNIQLNAEENRSYLDHLLNMPEGTAIDVWEEPKAIAQQLEAERSNRIDNLRTEGWKMIMGGTNDKVIEMRRMLGFQQAYEYYSAFLKKDTALAYNYGDISALDAELERIFGRDMLNNIDQAIKFAMNMYTSNRKASKGDVDKLSARLKIVLASNLTLEAPYYDLSNTAKQDSKSIPVSVTMKDGTKATVNIQQHNNMTERWIEGYRNARLGGIPVDKDMVEGFIGSIAQCKWAATLKPGQYSITFENDLHETRSFDVTVSKVGGDTKGAAANIKIEPMTTLEDLLKTPGGFRAYEGDRIVLRSKADNSVALASKSNFGVLMMASANVGGRGYERAVNQVSLMNDNLVPDGMLEEGTQPASFWTGLYFAVTKKDVMAFMSNRQMVLYDIAATFRPVREIRPEVPIKVEKVLGKEVLDFAALIGAPSDAGISTTVVDAGGAVHNWFSDLAEGKLTIDENGNVSAQIISRATGAPLTLGELKTALDRLGYTEGTSQRAIIMQHLFGSGPYDDNMVIEVVTTQQGNRVYIVTKGAQNMAQAEMGVEIDRQTIAEMRYGYLTDRLRLFIATQAQVKMGNQIINVRVELGKTVADFGSMQKFLDTRTAIVNAFLSSNLLGLGWTKVLSESGNALSAQPYLVAYLEHMAPHDMQRIMEVGGGVSGILETANAEIVANPQLTGITVGRGGDWNITPSLNLYNRWFVGRHFDLYQSASVHYRFPSAGLVDRASKGHLGGTWGGGGGLGFDYIIDRSWRLSLGGGYEYAPISMQEPVSVFNASTRLSFRNRLSLEVMANYQLDKEWGTENLPVLGRGVVAGKVALVYNFGRLDLTPKEKETGQKKGGKK